MSILGHHREIQGNTWGIITGNDIGLAFIMNTAIVGEQFGLDEYRKKATPMLKTDATMSTPETRTRERRKQR
jgi:hypothetical protein